MVNPFHYKERKKCCLLLLQFSDCGITLKTIEREDRMEAGEGGCARLKGKGVVLLVQMGC